MRPNKRLPYLPGLLAIGIMVTAAGVALVEANPDDNPPLAPLGPVPVPPDNKITQEKAELGRFLFFDPKLSGDASLSCADCHSPTQGWAFADPICRGYPGAVHWRNCQTVVNSGYLGKLFWQGNAKSLEAQAKTAASGAVSGNGEADVMEQRLRQTPDYIARFKEVFGTERPILNDAWLAIATFERAMLSQTDTPLDRYLRGNDAALSEKAKAGLELFKTKANCIECHNGPMLTDEKYYNLGVPRPLEWEETGLNAVTFRFELYAKGVTEEYYRQFKDDLGLYFTTKRRSDIGKFRTPPLRYVLYTPPYMHAGQFYTLEEVIDFYNDGGGENEMTERIGNKTPILKPLGLTESEKEALLAFLEEISGDEIEMSTPKVPVYEAMPDVAELTQAKAKRAGLESYLSAAEKR